MNREEILNEIDKALDDLRDVKARTFVTLSHAKELVRNEEQIPYSESYNKGLEDGRNEVWELAKKIADESCNNRAKIFKVDFTLDVFKEYTPQEALAKLEAYEKAQEEIKAGDYCVDEDGLKWLVTYVNKGELPNDIDYHCIDNKGYTSPVLYHKGELKKTGKYIDISSILEQIGGGE